MLQCFMLGPLVWSIIYDEILSLSALKKTTLIGFTNGLAMVIVAKYPEEVALY